MVARWRNRTMWATSCCLYDQFNLVKFAILYLPQRRANSNIGDGRRRSFSFGYIFGDFSRECSFFLMSSAPNYEANSWTFKCVVLSRKDAEFTSLKGNSKQKLSFYKETYANKAILYRLLKGFSHSFIVLTLFILLFWFQNKSCDIKLIFYTSQFDICCYLEYMRW